MEGNTNPGFVSDQRKVSALLDVETNDVNAHTYVYEPNLSLRRMTIEALPTEENYQNIKDKDLYRPNLDELMEGRRTKQETFEEEVEVKAGKVIKFGWVEGVFMRCLLNIWGTMLFLRLTWVVGQAGIVWGLVIISLANVVTLTSAISMSAISTNGQIAGGGVYYMISRSLGPALGGSIGLMFTMANTISVATYTIGFSESLLDLLADVIPGWNGIVVTQDECSVAGCRDMDVRIISAPALSLFLFIAFAGMDWVTRIQKTLLILLIFAQFDMLIGSFVSTDFGTLYVDTLEGGNYRNVDGDQRGAYGYTGWSLETAKENLWDQYTSGPMNSNPNAESSFMEVFGVFFTAVTGIVAGANLSGDLKDPSDAIPKGTLGAIFLTYVTYSYFAVQTGFIFLPQASGVAEEYRYSKLLDTNTTADYANPDVLNAMEFCNVTWEDMPKYSNCNATTYETRDCIKGYNNATMDIYRLWHGSEKGCEHGSALDQMTMTYTSFTGYLRYAGGFSASLSSAIASLVGAPRVLQAVGKDKIYPGVNFFAHGYTANNDPYRGYILVFVLAFGFAMLAKLNAVSVIASNFFLAAYALMNLSCFHSSITKAPSWRPSYKFYNHWVAFASVFLCLVIMFLLDPIWAGATIGITFLLGLYIYYRNPEANWGSSSQGQIFVDAVKQAHLLTETQDHVKNYRPKILAMTGNPGHRPALVDFANLLTKKVSLLICGHVLTGDSVSTTGLSNLKENVQMWLKDHAIRGFYLVNHSNTFEQGAKNCITMAGLGKLSPNLLLVGFKSDWKKNLGLNTEFFNTLICAFEQRLSVTILRVKDGFDYSNVIAAETSVVKEVPVTDDHSDDEGQGKPTLQPAAPVKTRKVSTAVYRTAENLPLESKTMANIEMFKDGKKTGYIDVWWLYDDGGLTLLLPYILTTRKQYKNAKLRVFILANRNDQLDQQKIQMATLLAKFRIDYSDVVVIPDITKKADPSTKAEFQELISDCGIPSDELDKELEKTNRHMRLAELLRTYSSESEMVVMTLPLPRKGHTNPALYMAWLDLMTKNLPPTLLIRGNQEPVLTFYS